MTTPADPTGVIITTSQMYAEMRAMSTTTTRIEGKVDALTGLGASVADHETRLRAVERRLWAIPGAGILIGVAGVLVAVWPTVGK